MLLSLTGRVIDLWKGADPKYPNTNVTLIDLTTDGKVSRVKISVPPALVSKFAMDAKLSVQASVTGRIIQNNLMLELPDDAKVEPVK